MHLQLPESLKAKHWFTKDNLELRCEICEGTLQQQSAATSKQFSKLKFHYLGYLVHQHGPEGVPAPRGKPRPSGIAQLEGEPTD